MAIRPFTDRLLDLPKRPKAGFDLLFDTLTPGLAFRVPARGQPQFQVVARDIQGREKRVKIASWIPHGAIDCTGARLDLNGIRALATSVRANVRNGRPPLWTEVQERPAWRLFTLAEALEMHIAGGLAAGRVMPSTERLYRDTARLYLGDWLNRPLVDLDRSSVRQRHLEVAGGHGPGVANATVRILRAAWNRAARQHPELGDAPTTNVDMFRLAPRDYGLREEDIRRLWELFESLDPVRRDYFQTILFTGLRRRSVAELRCEDVDPISRTVRIQKPKGGERRAFTLPVCNQLHAVFERRALDSAASGSPWLFPAASSSGHLEEPRADGVPPPHAIRHLFASVAGNLVPAYPLKALLNHARSSTDVTAGYVNLTPEQLRPHAQLVADHIQRLAVGG